nr:CRISPR-associated protein Cas5 [Streptomyces sp. CBMA29]
MPDDALPTWRFEFYAPVASFRDPLFPGLSHGLPVPPPSTVRGMLAAATGKPSELVPFGMASYGDGNGVDAETYHPIDAGGANRAVSGRVRAGKGGMTIRDRPFLVGVHLTVWIPGRDGDRIEQALRRPRWALRLGRSQDIVHLRERCQVALEPASDAVVDHALAPVGSHAAPSAVVHRLASAVSTDRLTTTWADYQWCEEQTGNWPVSGAYRERTVPGQDRDLPGRAVWLLTP